MMSRPPPAPVRPAFQRDLDADPSALVNTFLSPVSEDIPYLSTSVQSILASSQARQIALDLKGSSAVKFLNGLAYLLSCDNSEYDSEALLLLQQDLACASGEWPSHMVVPNLTIQKSMIRHRAYDISQATSPQYSIVCVRRATPTSSTVQAGEPQIRRRALAHRRLSHPHLDPFIGILATPCDPLGILLPFSDSASPRTWLASHPESFLPLIIQIAQALDYMHHLKPPFIHGDLQMAHIAIGPFGQAVLGGLYETTTLESEPEYCSVSSRHRAPDLLNRSRIGTHSDIYSFAITIHEISSPDQPMSPFYATRAWIEAHRGGRPRRYLNAGILSHDYCDELWDLMDLMWAQEPADRPTASKVVESLCHLKQETLIVQECQLHWNQAIAGKHDGIQELIRELPVQALEVMESFFAAFPAFITSRRLFTTLCSQLQQGGKDSRPSLLKPLKIWLASPWFNLSVESSLKDIQSILKHDDTLFHNIANSSRSIPTQASKPFEGINFTRGDNTHLAVSSVTYLWDIRSWSLPWPLNWFFPPPTLSTNSVRDMTPNDLAGIARAFTYREAHAQAQVTEEQLRNWIVRSAKERVPPTLSKITDQIHQWVQQTLSSDLDNSNSFDRFLTIAYLCLKMHNAATAADIADELLTSIRYEPLEAQSAFLRQYEPNVQMLKKSISEHSVRTTRMILSTNPRAHHLITTYRSLAPAFGHPASLERCHTWWGDVKAFVDDLQSAPTKNTNPPPNPSFLDFAYHLGIPGGTT